MKVLLIMLIVMLLVAFAAPAFADEKGEPNHNACFGQFHKNIEDSGYDKVSAAVHEGQGDAADEGMNLGQFIKEFAKPVICAPIE